MSCCGKGPYGDGASDSISGAEFGSIAEGEPLIYRYKLWRKMSTYSDERTLLFVMLNPSVAGETHNDPTIRRCISFTLREGFGRLAVVNLFAYRATNPKRLAWADDPVGPKNHEYIGAAAAEAARVVCAWGAIPKRYYDRRDAVVRLLRYHHERLWCLGTTKAGEPRHPLMLRGDEPMVEYRT